MIAMPSRLPDVGTTIFTVMSKLAAVHDAINLSQGFPDFSPPPRLVERVAHHMAAGHNQYAPMAGVLPLREAIAAKVETLYGAAYDVEQEITVTAGATQAIFTAVAACVRPGDEVIVFAPAYDSYGPAVALAGGRTVHATLRHPDYKPDWNEVRALLNPRTRMIIVNTPHNPTGAVWSAEDVETLSALLRGTDIVLVADEVYEHMVFDGARHESIARHAELRGRSFVISSFGKTYHCTGWKVAYCLAPRELTAEFRKAHQFVVFAVNHPVQLAIADFMNEQPGFAVDLGGFYQGKRDFFLGQLAGSRFSPLPCAGTYFQLAAYDVVDDRSDVEFARWLTAERGVAVIPVSVFYPGGDDHRVVRFCFAKNEATLAAAGERLRAV
ncbi:MAG: pyridoxal phosphate-dependent aminotransferase [Gammaproteobacteria bacterium]|nr:pyridoxal phosphate-dependent aminotransferase [Gammaproteobacteria bacterium]MBU1414625.1 pyridoxal phosphate-dependent aminotransferase [Gammaproteobacteria bacterium]